MPIPRVSLDPLNPDKTLAELARRDNARYQQDYVPVEDGAIATLQDTRGVEDARDATKLGFSRVKDSIQRDLARYGIRASAIESKEAAQGFRFNRTKTIADNVNNARLDQFDRNRGFRNELINIGRGVASDAQGNLSEAAGMKTSRDNNNAAASSANKAQRINTIGNIASSALFAAMVF